MLTVSRGKRFLGSFINVITLNFLFIGNFIMVAAKGQTLGGAALGYKYENGGLLTLLKIWGGMIISGLMYGFTLGIMFIVDLVTMGKRDGWMWENWFECKKVSSR